MKTPIISSKNQVKTALESQEDREEIILDLKRELLNYLLLEQSIIDDVNFHI